MGWVTSNAVRYFLPIRLLSRQTHPMSVAGDQPQAHHIPRIDVLRAAAILLVFSSHFDTAVYGAPGYSWIGNWYHWNDSPSWLGQGLRITVFNGNLGVSLFFVISGLCIRLSQLGSKNFLISHFYWRRFWRIYPSYLLALCIFIIWQHYGNLSDILAHIFLIHNLSRDYFTSINSPFWSLALEVQVYLLYPCLLALHRRFGALRTGIFFFSLSVIPEVISGETFRHICHLPDSFEVIRQLPTSLWFTWYAGFLLADALVAQASPRVISRSILVGTILLFPAFKLYRPLLPFQLPIAGIMLTLLVFEYLNSRSAFSTAERILGYLGICSYSFYLYFDRFIYPCLNFLTSWSHISSPTVLFAVGYPMTLLVIFAFAYSAYQAVELKSISLGRSLLLRLQKPRPKVRQVAAP
jgi:peptidoglycan/LPS O-acetylase OafA/YrhL